MNTLNKILIRFLKEKNVYLEFREAFTSIFSLDNICYITKLPVLYHNQRPILFINDILFTFRGKINHQQGILHDLLCDFLSSAIAHNDLKKLLLKKKKKEIINFFENQKFFRIFGEELYNIDITLTSTEKYIDYCIDKNFPISELIFRLITVNVQHYDYIINLHNLYQKYLIVNCFKKC